MAHTCPTGLTCYNSVSSESLLRAVSFRFVMLTVIATFGFFIYTCDHDLSGQYILLILLLIYSVYQIANYPRHFGFHVEISDTCVF